MTAKEKNASPLSAAILEVGGKLAPDKSNRQDGYEYVSADKMLTVCGQVLASHSINITPEITDHSIEILTSANGKHFYHAEVILRFTVRMPDGTSTQHDWFGAGVDYRVPDKAYYKAITTGTRYFLSTLLLVGKGNEDGEHQEAEGAAGTERKPQSAKARKPAKNGKPQIGTHTVPEVMVAEGIAENVPNAAAILNQLNVFKLTHQEQIELARLYRTWRNTGLAVDEAVVAALAGKVPEKAE